MCVIARSPRCSDISRRLALFRGPFSCELLDQAILDWPLRSGGAFQGHQDLVQEVSDTDTAGLWAIGL